MMLQRCKTLCVPILGVHFGTFENFSHFNFQCDFHKKIHNIHKNPIGGRSDASSKVWAM